MAGFAHAKIQRRIWTDPDFIALDEAAQRAYFLLISQPGLSVAGVIPLQTRKLARLAADTTIEGIEKAIQRLIHDRYVLVDDFTEELLIRTYIRHDGGFRTPNIHKAIVSAIAKVESNELRAVATAELAAAATNSSSQGTTDAVRDTLPDPSDEGIHDLTAACSLPPTDLNTAASSARPITDDDLSPSEQPPAAAAALELFAEHRALIKKPGNPGGFKDKIRREEPIRYAREFAAIGPDEDPLDVVVRIFKISPAEARAASRSLGKAVPEPPPCKTCDGYQIITIDEATHTTGPCPDCATSEVSR